MSVTWTAKAPGDVYRYTWTPALAEGDSLASYTVSVSGAVIEADELSGDAVALFVSGGTVGATAAFTFTAITADGETLTETVYLSVLGEGGITVQDIVSFALRKVTGSGETPDADQAADALERLADMLEEWRVTGADVGAPRPLTLSTVIYSPHSHVSAIKNSLIVRLSDLYGSEIMPSVATAAVRGLQLVKMANIDPMTAEYF